MSIDLSVIFANNIMLYLDILSFLRKSKNEKYKIKEKIHWHINDDTKITA